MVDEQKDTKKMATARCSHLIAKGIARRVDEMWIARQPVLLSVYLHTYAPWLSRQVSLLSVRQIDCVHMYEYEYVYTVTY